MQKYEILEELNPKHLTVGILKKYIENFPDEMDVYLDDNKEWRGAKSMFIWPSVNQERKIMSLVLRV